MSPSRKPLVFVVDDEPTIATTTATILEGAGFAAEAFVDPREALKATETRCPDAVISDVLMPQLNGIDLGVQIKARCPECRVMLFAGQTATDEMLEEARNKGHHFEVISKPIPPKDLIATIRAMVVRAD